MKMTEQIMVVAEAIWRADADSPDLFTGVWEWSNLTPRDRKSYRAMAEAAIKTLSTLSVDKSTQRDVELST